jgi:hypothetical protein
MPRSRSSHEFSRTPAVDLDGELLPAELADVGSGFDPQARRVGVCTHDAERGGAGVLGGAERHDRGARRHEARGGQVGPVVAE